MEWADRIAREEAEFAATWPADTVLERDRDLFSVGVYELWAGARLVRMLVHAYFDEPPRRPARRGQNPRSGGRVHGHATRDQRAAATHFRARPGGWSKSDFTNAERWPSTGRTE